MPSQTEVATSSLALLALSDSPGIKGFKTAGYDSCGVYTIDLGNRLSAVVLDVDSNDFSADSPTCRTDDATWVTPRALRHDAILKEALALGSVLPLPFATVFSGHESLVKTVSTNRGRIDSFFDSTRNSGEYAVRFSIESSELSSLVDESVEKKLAADLPEGIRFLRSNALRGDTQRSILDQLITSTDQACERLDELATDSADRKAFAEEGHTPLSSLAFLVPLDRESELEQVLDSIEHDLTAHRISVSAHGPIPAYSFTPRIE